MIYLSPLIVVAIADLNQLSQQISSFAQSPEFNISLATKNDVNLSSNANRPVIDSSVRLIQELLAETKQKCAKMVRRSYHSPVPKSNQSRQF